MLQALAKAEDESDVKAATMAHAEQDAELAEFDESIPYEGEEKEGEEGSKVEMELAQLDSQVKEKTKPKSTLCGNVVNLWTCVHESLLRALLYVCVDFESKI